MRLEPYDGKERRGTYLLFFHADWSVPSKYMQKALQELEVSSEGLVCYLVDVNDNFELIRKYKVAVVPTLLAVQDGEVKGVIEGYRGQGELRRFLSSITQNVSLLSRGIETS